MRQKSEYKFIPYLQERDSVGRLIRDDNAFRPHFSRTARDVYQQQLRAIDKNIDYHRFMPSPGTSDRRRTSIIVNPSGPIRSYQSYVQDPIVERSSPSSPQRSSKIAVHPGKTSIKFFADPDGISNRITEPKTRGSSPITRSKSAFVVKGCSKLHEKILPDSSEHKFNDQVNSPVRGASGLVPFAIKKHVSDKKHKGKLEFVVNEQEMKKLIEMTSKQGRARKLWEDLPLTVRVSSLTIRDTPGNMHDRWKQLEGKVSGIRKSVASMKLWP